MAAMTRFSLSCTGCEATFDPLPENLRCPACSTPLTVDYGPSGRGAKNRWGATIPLRRPRLMITMGEGDTPMVELEHTASELGIRSLQAKLESHNPTGSFKDRGAAMMMSFLAEHGVTALVEDSSGNAGAAVAAYAERAGINAHIFVPESAPADKVANIERYGAEIHAVAGPRERASVAAQRFAEDRGIIYCSHNLSPHFIEGVATIGYELTRQDGRHLWGEGAADHIVVPVGNGSLLIALHLAMKRIEERREFEMPRLHAVQAKAAMPIVAAHEGRRWEADPEQSTVAGGIASVAPPRMNQILEALSDSGGTAVAVEDQDILRWQDLIAARDGIDAEPTSAAAFAGLDQLVKSGVIDEGDSVVVPITGSRLKGA